MKPRVPFWSSLRVRVMIGVVVPLTIVLAVAAQIQYTTHHDLMLENLKEFSVSVGDGVETALTQSMLNQDRDALGQIVRDLASGGSIRRVMILDPSGVVRVSSQASDLDTRPSLTAGSGRSFILTQAGGSTVFRNVTTIQNRPVCQPCHGIQSGVNGTLVIDLPYEGVQAHLATDLRESILLSAAAIILVSIAINLLLNRIVVAKLERFRSAIAGFARGDFSSRVDIAGSDEVGELARAVNAMAVGLGEKALLEKEVDQNARELERRSARLSALYRVALESSRSLDLGQVMRTGLESALSVMNMEAGEIRLDAEPGGTLRLQSFIGSPPDFVKEEDRIAVGECLCGRVAERGEVLAVDQIMRDPQVTRLACRRYGFCSLAAVPLQARGHPVGVLSLHSRAAREFSKDDVTTLQALGDQLGVAIDNARLYTEMGDRVRELSRRVQHLAVTEERVRLAREMHDGLAQALTLLNLKLQVLRGRTDGQREIAAGLDEMRAIVGEAYEDARQAISDLRTPIDQDGKIADNLVDYVQNFSLRHDLQARVVLSPDAREARCASDASPQVLRIVQEVLTNVRKHARAKEIGLNLERENGHLRICLHDDGSGFDPRAAGGDGHYGLSIMRERAASFGGELSIESSPGCGTTVMLTVPIVA